MLLSYCLSSPPPCENRSDTHWAYTLLVRYSEKYYRASIARGCVADTRAVEVPADYETKARKVGAE